MSGYAKGPFAVDWEDRYDFPALRRQRVAAAQESLRHSDIDALLVWKDENVRYLTSLRAQLIAGKTTSLNGALLGPDEDPVLLCSGGEIDKASMGMSGRVELDALGFDHVFVAAADAGLLVRTLATFGNWCVTNKTGMDVAGINVSFSAVINGRVYNAQSRGGAMAAGASLGLSPGWRIGADDVVEQVDVRVTTVAF